MLLNGQISIFFWVTVYCDQWRIGIGKNRVGEFPCSTSDNSWTGRLCDLSDLTYWVMRKVTVALHYILFSDLIV